MSEEHKDAVAGFEGSTGDESYLNPPDKKGMANINKALKGAKDKDPVTLPGLADAINHEYEQGELMRRQTCAQFIEVGRLLNVARLQFTSNTKFGTWRKKAIDFSQSHVQRLMQVATEFGDNEDAALLPFGTLAVLTNASEDLKDKVVADAKDGKTTTRAEVTAAKKDEKESPPESADEATAQMEGSTKDDEPEEPEPESDPVAEAQVLLDMPFKKREPLIKVEGSRNPFHAACLLYGIPPYHDGHPSLDLVSNLYFSHTDKVTANDPENTALLDKLTEAHDILQSVIKLAD